MTTEHRTQVCPLHDSLRRQLRPAEMDSGDQEAFRQPGRPAVHVSLRAEGRSFHTRSRHEEDLQRESCPLPTKSVPTVTVIVLTVLWSSQSSIALRPQRP